MATEPIITNERVDDIPILLTPIQKMSIGKLIDKHFPTHGNEPAMFGQLVAAAPDWVEWMG
ncbi:hypothetical protein NIES21_60850 (plasmid) [Anabaenopsis circularis NIES-21]|uniref:Uncharacterized protein n=1 Tax=Anabaenopsis circularis NIES-21 TaxID=1085406 RepID=A0A1Z4GRT0_9CYAN|nr:hypothetical protein NIES21_60850 [Anabaenopsis circularis NIES-21]